ncbi:hypothetical protein I302_101988 [Kwoniella bestiolae CBS 10118]|uniref:Fungal lipase-type domain-containing protein n=1 Tax=Kwoniella bestiolae CBS 10118 TaxID=1296100 RepID=A0A1B9GDT4_9TREE|nr:hypothetical protein I302_00672 [Kwoniella bestiolae CBS 10118]OCF29176.1 hypothetical protein I302_00672 [Kwoniella bestiolae CBS 10118]
MRVTIPIILASLLPFGGARPSTTRPSISILTANHNSLGSLPRGKTQLSHDDMLEIGRMAIAINSAYCPKQNKLQPHPPNSFISQLRNSRRHRESQHPHMEESSIIVSSEDPEYIDDQSTGGDMKWYISHTPSTQTLTLALSSLPSTDDLLELLASSPPDNQTLVPFQNLLFPFEHLSPSSVEEKPKIHHVYVDAIQSHGNSAMLALLELIENPPLTITSSVHKDIIKEYVTALTQPLPAVRQAPIRRIEIIGHGLGSVVGLMVSLALQLERPSPSKDSIEITANLLGMPRIGNTHFAHLVDQFTQHHGKRNHPSLRFNRIISYFDTIAHLPERHLGLEHHSNNEFWIGPDPRVVYWCKSPVGREECSEGVKLGKTSLMDHLGPYGGVWLDPHCKVE